jgi:tRNA modification GTPase
VPNRISFSEVGLDEPRPSEGLGEKLPAPKDTIEETAQKKSVEILEQADLVLLVLDNSQANDQLDERFGKKIAGKLVPSTSSGQALSEAEGKILTVLNKCDLPAKFDTGVLTGILSNTIQISAQEGIGIEDLLEKIRQISGVTDFDLKTAVVFSTRQENLLQQLKSAESKQQAASIITELLNSQV